MESNTQSAEIQAITITPATEKFMRRMVRFGGQGERAGFRLIVRPGGCSGMSSEFSVEAMPHAGDRALSFNGLQLFLPPESRAFRHRRDLHFELFVDGHGGAARERQDLARARPSVRLRGARRLARCEWRRHHLG